MKPSEKRAMKEQKKSEGRQKDAENRIWEFHSDDSDNWTEVNHDNGKVSDDRGKRLHKEGFVQSHIKLITFIVCMVLFLALLGPWSIYQIIEAIDFSNRDENSLTDISMLNAYGISEKKKI